MEYDNTNTLKAWKNDSENPKAPMWTGIVNMDGIEKRVSIWFNAAQDGKKEMISGKLEFPQEVAGYVNAGEVVSGTLVGTEPMGTLAPQVAEDTIDEIPF